MDHNFNVNIANVYGVEEAILIHNIYFWILKNKANKKHFYDDNYWTYNSIEAFTELFPYWTKRQLERIIKNTIEKGALIKGNYNKLLYDRTSWYAITETVKCIYANGEMDFTKHVNGFTQTVEPIPDSNTYSNTDIKKKYRNFTFSEIKNFKEFYSSFEFNKKYFYISFKFWKMWQEEDPKSKTIISAKLVNWYESIRLIIENDKQRIERLIAIYIYFKKCQQREIGYRLFWFNTVKSVGGLREINKNGEYRLDKIADEVNEKIEKDDSFNRLVIDTIDNFNKFINESN